MNLNFVGVNEKIVNLDAIALIEDTSDDRGTRILLTTTAGTEIELVGSDAEAVLARAELMIDGCTALLSRIAAVEPPPPQT